jgi:hypothetical protein
MNEAYNAKEKMFQNHLRKTPHLSPQYERLMQRIKKLKYNVC